jgi:Ca-activated chloride channel family protein
MVSFQPLKSHVAGPARAGAVALGLVFLGLAAEGRAAQEPPSPPTFESEVSVGYVYVPVVVRSSDGYVSDLEQEDFKLQVDGRPAAIETFETGVTAPVSIVFLQDLSGSMANSGKLDQSRETVECFLREARSGDEYALAWFAGDIFEVDVPFTSEVAVARDAMAAWEAYGTTALHNAVARLPAITAGRGALKRAALLITDGVDNASTVDPEQARELVRQAELPVYVLGFDSGSAYERREAGGKVYRFADTLNLLASLSGGRYYPVSRPEDLKAACGAILEDLRHQYVLGFSTVGTGPAREHRLRVEVAGRGKRVLSHRRSYRGTAPAVAPAATSGGR